MSNQVERQFDLPSAEPASRLLSVNKYLSAKIRPLQVVADAAEEYVRALRGGYESADFELRQLCTALRALDGEP